MEFIYNHLTLLTIIACIYSFSVCIWAITAIIRRKKGKEDYKIMPFFEKEKKLQSIYNYSFMIYAIEKSLKEKEEEKKVKDKQKENNKKNEINLSSAYLLN